MKKPRKYLAQREHTAWISIPPFVRVFFMPELQSSFQAQVLWKFPVIVLEFSFIKPCIIHPFIPAST